MDISRLISTPKWVTAVATVTVLLSSVKYVSKMGVLKSPLGRQIVFFWFFVYIRRTI